MKWIAFCVALAGLATASFAEPAMSPMPAHGRYIQLAQTCPPPGILRSGQCVCPPTIKCPLITNCPAPKVVDTAANSCVCPAGMHEAANGACVTCAAPKQWDAAKRLCTCPPGMALSPAGRCVRCPPPALQRGRLSSCG